MTDTDVGDILKIFGFIAGLLLIAGGLSGIASYSGGFENINNLFTHLLKLVIGSGLAIVSLNPNSINT